MTGSNQTPGGGAGASGGGEDEPQIGYKKPPKATQWKKGQSGNPKGRKPKEKIEDLRIVFDQILIETVTVKFNGRTEQMTKLDAIVEQIRTKALQGEPKAIRALLKMTKSAGILSKSAAPKYIIITDPVTPDSDMGRVIQMMPEPAETSEGDEP
jgi:hypothetical protein